MRRWPMILGAIAIVAVLAIYLAYWSLVPHIGRASREEILAAIPPDLRAPEPPDPAAEARYRRFTDLLHETFEREDADWDAYTQNLSKLPRPTTPKYTSAQIADYERRCEALTPKIQALFAEGDLCYTRSAKRGIDRWRRAKMPEKRVLEAARRGDFKFCVTDALWRIRLSNLVERVSLSNVSLQDFDEFDRRENWQTIYRIDMAGGYDRQGRDAIYRALVYPDREDFVRSMLRPYFYAVLLPQVIEIAAGEDYWKVTDPDDIPVVRAGSFDPNETVKLMCEGLRACEVDLNSPPNDRKRIEEFRARVRKRLEDIPPNPGSILNTDDYLQSLDRRASMNRVPNSLGADWAASSFPGPPVVPQGMPPDPRVHFNLVRAVLLLHQGRKDLPFDPYTKKPLKFDPNRRLVWSVGPNKKDRAKAQVYVGAQAGVVDDIIYRY